MDFVPEAFAVPTQLESDHFVLEPLGPQHNESDYAAWSSSREHIHATPGWEDSNWPDDRDLDANRRDLERHAQDFRNRDGFTYTVLDPGKRNVIGCVYIYPARDSEEDARVLSWVRADRSELDTELWREVSDWLAADWPFETVDYAARS
jgi:RimJ/RimL family protein N-acetyltransferase